MIQTLILIEFFAFFGFVAGFMLLQRLQGGDPLGEYPIQPGLFVVGKMSMGISWGFLAVQAARRRINAPPAPLIRQYTAALLMLIGIGFTMAAFLTLRNKTRFGVSATPKGLSTTGIYHLSRNPMYVGFYLVTLGSTVAVPHWINIACALIGILIHHRVVLAEEQALLEQYGDAYQEYTRRVRRYL